MSADCPKYLFKVTDPSFSVFLQLCCTKQSSLEIGRRKKFHEGEWHSKQQVRSNNEQKWRSSEPIIFDTNIGKYFINYLILRTTQNTVACIHGVEPGPIAGVKVTVGFVCAAWIFHQC